MVKSTAKVGACSPSDPMHLRLLEAREKAVNVETETALRLVKSDNSPTRPEHPREEPANLFKSWW